MRRKELNHEIVIHFFHITGQMLLEEKKGELVIQSNLLVSMMKIELIIK